MQITPLYRHAALRFPVVTSRFSDPFPVSSINVVDGGVTTLTSVGHGVAVGKSIAIAITDAPAPNPITAAVKLANGDWTLTTQYDHDLSLSPDPAIGAQWDDVALLSGFDDAAMNGLIQLVSISDRFTFTVRPSSEVAAIVLNGAETQLKSLEYEIVGWHKVTAATVDTLTFPTPATVTRSYVVANPIVVRNIRVFGAVSIDAVMRHYVRLDSESAANEITAFIVPIERTRVRAWTGTVAAVGPSQAVHSTIDDGFHVIVLIPSESYSAGVTALDLAEGDLLRAVMKTFNGLMVPRTAFPGGTPSACLLEEHGAIQHDGPTYCHVYTFSAPAQMSNDDRIQPWEAADLAAAGVGSTSVHRVGAPAYRDIAFSAITHSGTPGLLTASIELDIQT